MSTDSNSVKAQPIVGAQPWDLRVHLKNPAPGGQPKAAEITDDAAVLGEWTLPKDSFKIKDLPERLPPYVSAQLSPSNRLLLAESTVGLLIDAPTTVRLSLSPLGADTPAEKAVQAGFLLQMGQAILAAVAALWGVLCTLMPGKTQAAPASSSQSTERPLALSITVDRTLKGTRNGLPAWVAYQEIKGVSWDAHGKGTLVGNVKLFNVVTLPGLQSAFMPPFLRLMVPDLDLRLVKQVTQGLDALAGVSKHVAVLGSHNGGLTCALSSQSQVLGPLAGHTVHLAPESFEVVAGDKGAAWKGAMVATLGDAAGAASPALRLQGDVSLTGDLKSGTPSPTAPLTVGASLGMAHRSAPKEHFVPVDVVQLNARYDGTSFRASVTGGAFTNVAQKATVARTRNELAEPFVGKYLAALWASSTHYSLHVAAGADDADVAAKPSSSTAASSPTLVGDASSLGLYTPSLLTLTDDAESLLDPNWSQKLCDRLETIQRASGEDSAKG